METQAETPFVPIEGQCFHSKAQWIAQGRYCLTAHPDYLNTEHDGPEKGWRGAHFTALCFDQQGRRVRNGGDFQRAEAENAFPVWWIWPDQIVPLVLSLRGQNGADQQPIGAVVAS